MAVDLNAIVDQFILTAQEAVGSQLSQSAHPTSPKASVIPARSRHTTPSYPYITIDILDIRDENGWVTLREVNEADNLEYFTHKQVSIYYRSYGEGSIQVINDLQSYFRLERVRDEIRQALEGSVVETHIIDSLPVKLTDEYIESSSLSVIFNIEDSYVDTSTGLIESIELSGEVHRSGEDDTPFSVLITVPE